MTMRALALAALTACAAQAGATDVGVSINIGQPGFYGQLNLGTNMVPQLVLPQPVLIAPPPPTAVMLPPLYLRVPLDHSRNWARFCNQYNACGRQVYFVRDDWYQNVYAPRYREHPDEFRGDDNPGRHLGHEKHGKGHGRGHGKGHGHDDD